MDKLATIIIIALMTISSGAFAVTSYYALTGLITG